MIVSNMIKIYNSEDISGESLIYPLKSYNHFFAENIKSGSILKGLILRVVQIAIGVLVYPLFGISAIIGMGVKMSDLVPSVIRHNQSLKNNLNLMQNAYKNSNGFSLTFQDRGKKPMVKVFTYALTKQSVDQHILSLNNKIDKLSDLFKQAYVKPSPSMKPREPVRLELQVACGLFENNDYDELLKEAADPDMGI